MFKQNSSQGDDFLVFSSQMRFILYVKEFSVIGIDTNAFLVHLTPRDQMSDR